MKRFLKHILLFAVPVILFFIGLEIYMRSLPNEYRYKSQWMEKNMDSVETIIIGSSRGYYGIRPDCLSSKAFNLASISSRPDYDNWVLHEYAGKAKKLKNVVYPVYYELFFDPPFEECEEWPRASYFKIYWGCPRHSLLSRYSLEVSSLFAIKDKLLMITGDDGMPCDSLGYGLQTNHRYVNPVFKTQQYVVNTIRKQTASDERYVDYNYRCVEDIAKCCRENGLRLIIVYIPCTKLYASMCRQQEQYDKFMKLTHKLVDEYNLEFYDYNDSPLFEDDDLFDTNHLNETGAEKFSKILDKLIENKQNDYKNGKI